MADIGSGKYQVSSTDARGVVIGEGNVVIQNFTAGLTALATDYGVRVENFLSEYLGTAKQPIPFGGRDRELQALGDWLADAAAPPYLLLAAPAGRGKSALLVQWLRLLATRPDINVAFAPISVRFRTNLAVVVFAIVAARLAKLQGKPLPAALSAEEWRGVMSGHFSNPAPDGKPLLLILDGMDEAADWKPGPDLFPLAPPSGLRLVVSARFLAGDADAKPWLERLGWTRPGLARTLTLEPLDRDGVTDLLDSIRPPLETAGTDLVGQLYRLTEGDPLLLHLYVAHFTERGPGKPRLRPQDLPDLPPGLPGYFKRWWDEQHQLWGHQAPLREPAVKAVLNLLAGALGPLTRDDLLQLEPSLDTWSLPEVLDPLRRFIIGDGEQQGFAYSHPRLAAYFHEGLTPAEQRKLDDRFLAWGAETVSAVGGKDSLQADIPSYLAQHYSTHLLRAGQRDDLMGLINKPGWYEAQLVGEPSGASFINDIRQAWMISETGNGTAVDQHQPLRFLGGEVGCALMTASLRSLSYNIPATVLVGLVATGWWNPRQALEAARQNPDSAARAKAIGILATFIPDESERLTALQQALLDVRALDNTSAYPSRKLALADLSPHLPTALLVDALTIARTTFDWREQVDALGQFLPYLPPDLQLETLQEALAAARALPEVDASEWAFGRNERVLALLDLIPHVPDASRPAVVAEALASARATASHQWRATMLARLAPDLTEPERSQAIREALAAVPLEEWGQGQAQALEELAPVIPEELLEEVVRATEQLSWAPGRGDVLVALAPRLPVALVQKALRIAEALEPGYRQGECLAALLPRLAEVGDAATALTAARSIKNRFLQERTLAAIAPRIAERVAPDDGLGLAQAIQSSWIRLEALAGLIGVLPEPYRRTAIEEALAAAQDEQVQAVHARGNADRSPVVELVLLLAHDGFDREALHLARTLPEQDAYGHQPRVDVLADLLPAASDQFREDILREALAGSRAIHDNGEQALASASLGSLLPPEMRADVQAAAVQAAHIVVDPEKRSRVLARMLPIVNGPLASQILTDALTCLRHLDMGVDRQQLVASLVPYLTPSAIQMLLGQGAGSTDADPVEESAGDEAWQAWLLNRLAAELPISSLAPAIERAQSFKGVGSRVEALAALLPRLAPPARHDLLQRLLDDVAALPAIDSYENSPRAESFEQVAPHIEVPFLDQVTTIIQSLATAETASGHMRAVAALAPRLAELGYGRDALDATKAIGWEWRRAEALAGVVRHLSAPLLQEAGSLAMEIRDPSRRSVIVALVARLPAIDAEPLLVEALVATLTPDAWAGAGDYSDMLPSLVTRLTPTLLQETLGEVRTLERLEVRAKALALLARYMPGSERERVYLEALDAAEAVDDVDDRAQALGAISEHLPEALLPRTLETLRAVPKGKYLFINSRAEALAILAPRLARLSVDKLYPLWRDTLHALAARARPELLWDLWALPPVLAALSGAPGLAAAAQAIRDVGERWP